MSKTALICGSYAFDSIMVFQDHFKNHILPDKVHMLNVSFLAPTMRKEFGGCGGNIAYNLHLLGANSIPMATVGEDFTPYMNWMELHHMNTTHMKVIKDSYTGQAFITTDMDDNQITAFHPGAMSNSHENKVSDVSVADIGIVSPDGRDGMIEHALQFAEAEIPFIFDPGQGMPMFSGEELVTFIEQATYVAVNDYESQMLQDKTGLDLATIASMVDSLIITKGGKGSEIHTNGEIITIIPAKAESTQDPTGCGDAYRAGLLYGIMSDFDWKKTGQLAGLLGAIKIAHLGTQNHKFDINDIEKLYQDNYGSDLN
ncbi:Sugar kinase [uncultured Gammaproteobacteria bacterium]|uniref:carbohydrate kinase family protein n=1 Tax=Bathymodiolus heckerae thiotrophic gill symbiont TaxID=1052212 RepID=UPI0010AF2B71|nr:carbohydrate kinase family protein [Bathymodiolus heckerae thiotrophic gill symbiont]CAC9547316.1 Sugar kinase [uncultured Gammaproteobacteria bacterium]CAC9578792.1 Sugar kinase [uncultured Gammaproteobacteria bacterium]CAC9583937.1 Sugar kinase [uncultured Gammaproteobacteria bacterium]SHN92850.1 Sugar kinases, ribokinase family [Bathymodiolus heckerae thiotrophic gill symbiont]